ncbi:MAG: hypothetical protein HKN47_04835 [Pirellulaceae bacterium]|nr:hypothetical protein [Pirellulaceae bacterium]
MSVPRDILDQLLSGYLDDVLSNDEREQVERLLQDDVDVAHELEDLRRIRGTLRDISRADAPFRLDDGFADRVLGAAVAQARTEGLAEDHPLLRVAEQPSTTEPAKGITLAKAVTAMVALAASIAVAIVVFQSDQQNDPVNQNPGNSIVTQAVPQTTDPIDVPSPDGNKIPNGPTEFAPGSDPLDSAIVMTPETPTTDRVPPDTISDPTSATDPAMATSPDQAVANNNSKSPGVEPTATNRLPTEAELLEQMQGLSGVLAINVQLTESGRLSHAVQEAMRNSSIKAIEEKVVSDKMVSSIAESMKGNQELVDGTRVFYLEAPGKKIDVLIGNLIRDVEGVQSVGLGLVMTPPVRRIAQSLKEIDPTSVRHDTSWQLRGDAVSTVARELSSQSYLPIHGDAIPATAPSNSDGPDQLSQLLILVR